ncbi:uncharacterized protein DSM5745_00122 [Aspergillus mulundensis]|uniref:Thymidylate kinase n=1 Tax=Aspergillus mulundensis TaxID=1810919 RepID=A0A3D8T2N8_9EURO|nr:Uncharacterized protein DSM5745_00122 [Aspergillus mulundensis]RDW92800.1 Uncharacterized protein DSM5745_00122 [Aspergillus mulundensis]
MSPAAVRQPFAPLDAPRLRSILRTKMNVLNKQDGNMLSGKKQPLAEFDSENIHPSALKSTKRKRSADDEDDHAPAKSPMKPIKSSSIGFSIFEDSIAPSTPTKTSQLTPKSAPLKPAGRSPQLKASKPFARRATISKSRPDCARKGVGRPFSLAAALSSGKSKPKSQAATPAPKMPASWSFDIYVDSEQEEMTNLMQHSTCVLDISDDEDREEIKSDHRGKENIPPADLGISLPRTRQQGSPAAARKSDTLDEPRSPLGELNAADYYGDDCHAFSYAVVFDEEDEAPVEKKVARSKLSSMSSIESVLEAAGKVAEESVEDST